MNVINRNSESYYITTQRFVSKMWTPAKYLMLIFTTLFLTSQGVNYAHDVLPPDHNHLPTFGSAATDVYVSENLSDYLIGNLKATDEDEDDTLTYSLNSDLNVYLDLDDNLQPYGHFFTINSGTAELRTSGALDFEAFIWTLNEHIFLPVWIKVEDGNGGSANFSYQVFIADENDNAPVFSADSQSLSINENEPSDTTVGTVSASDADAFAGDHTYSIETENVPFTIESSKRSGTLKTTSVLDYEATSSYTLTVKVDDGFGTDTISVTIAITNDPSDDPTTQQPVVDPGQPDDTETEPEPDESTPADPTPEEPPRVISKLSTPGQIGFSELMIASEGGLHSRSQWIELHNNSNTEAVNLWGWKLEIEARDADGGHRHVVIPLEDLPIPANQTVLIVTWRDGNSGDFPENRIYNFFGHHSDEFEQNEHRNMVLGRVGFFLKLSDPDGAISDVVGNLDGNGKTEDEPAWELPSGMTEDGARTSLMRRYNRDTGVLLDGTLSSNWVSASNLQLGVMTYWGRRTDIGNPGYRGEGALPVQLSGFRSERLDTGLVMIEWITESELNNAGFNILRSQTAQGPFVKVNPTLIAGAGTTSERQTYKWQDTTAELNVTYYYRIEDVSFSGDRQRLATTRMRGHVSAAGKITATWGSLKTQN